MLNSQGNSNAQAITTRQKLAVAFLLSFTFLMIGMAAYSMRSNLRESLAYGGEQKKITDVEGGATSTDEYLKERDTDKDGISDFEELKAYNTSPFLPDTDGDGVNDADELKNGTNPACPEGQNCSNRSGIFNAESGTGASSTEMAGNGQQAVFTDEQLKQLQQLGQLADVESQLNNSGLAAGTSSLSQSGSKAGADLVNSLSSADEAAQNSASGLGVADKAQAQAILKGGASAANLREALLKAGLAKEQLDQISDDDLLKNYQAMLNKQSQ